MAGIGASLVEEIKGNPGELAKPTSAQAVKSCSICCWLWSGPSTPPLRWPGLEAQPGTFEPQLSLPDCCPRLLVPFLCFLSWRGVLGGALGLGIIPEVCCRMRGAEEQGCEETRSTESSRNARQRPRNSQAKTGRAIGSHILKWVKMVRQSPRRKVPKWGGEGWASLHLSFELGWAR